MLPTLLRVVWPLTTEGGQLMGLSYAAGTTLDQERHGNECCQGVTAGSAAGDDLHDLQPVARAELAPGEFRWRHGFAVVLDHHAARQELLRDQEFLDRAGKPAWTRCPLAMTKESS